VIAGHMCSQKGLSLEKSKSGIGHGQGNNFVTTKHKCICISVYISAYVPSFNISLLPVVIARPISCMLLY
jgi:hypothetical protein